MSIKGSEAHKQRLHKLLWMLWFDEKLYLTYSKIDLALAMIFSPPPPPLIPLIWSHHPVIYHMFCWLPDLFALCVYCKILLNPWLDRVDYSCVQKLLVGAKGRWMVEQQQPWNLNWSFQQKLSHVEMKLL